MLLARFDEQPWVIAPSVDAMEEANVTTRSSEIVRPSK